MTWNCRKGLVEVDNTAGVKLNEIENYMNENDVDLFAINEAGIHGKRSRTIRTNPMDDESVNLNLTIENYKIWLPQQWEKHDIARTIVYTREDLNVKRIKTDMEYDDLPLDNL